MIKQGIQKEDIFWGTVNMIYRYIDFTENYTAMLFF